VTYAWHPFHGRAFVVRAYGRGELVRCVAVDDAGGASFLLPQWMFDPIACARMRRSSEAWVSIAALEDLRRVLIEAQPLDTRCSPHHTATHAPTSSSSSSESTESPATASVSSDMEQPTRTVSRRGHHAARRAAETASDDRRGETEAWRRR
jgi:hypothetical protein